MAMIVEATYENGVLKPAGPLPLKEHEIVRITVHPQPTSPLGASPILQAHGILEWSGSAETLERFALDPEFDVQEGT